MSTRDPALPSTGRVGLAGAVYLVTLAAAGACAWGWAGMFQLSAGDSVAGPRILGLVLGQFGAIGGLIATVFALPRQWRGAGGPGWAIVGGLLAGLDLAVAAGLLVSGVPRTAAGFAAGGVVIAVVTWWRARARRTEAELHQHIRRTGRRTDGVVTEVDSHSRVNGVPRRRIVVRFTDAEGTRRWVTKHALTHTPPRTGRSVVVFHDPARPGDQRRIVVDW